MKTSTLPVTIVLGFTALTLGAVIFLAPFIGSDDTPAFPDIPPAGYCILTDGERFAFSKPKLTHGERWTSVSPGFFRTEMEAIHFAWAIREYHAAPNPERAYIPAHPELCKEFK